MESTKGDWLPENQTPAAQSRAKGINAGKPGKEKGEKNG
jgi:hypothetical protein